MKNCCYKIYDDLDGSFIDCNSECMLYTNECYLTNDVDALIEFRAFIPSLLDSEHILSFLSDNQYYCDWNLEDESEDYGRLKEINFNIEINHLPDAICNLTSLEQLSFMGSNFVFHQ